MLHRSSVISTAKSASVSDDRPSLVFVCSVAQLGCECSSWSGRVMNHTTLIFFPCRAAIRWAMVWHNGNVRDIHGLRRQLTLFMASAFWTTNGLAFNLFFFRGCVGKNQRPRPLTDLFRRPREHAADFSAVPQLLLTHDLTCPPQSSANCGRGVMSVGHMLDLSHSVYSKTLGSV